MVMGSCRALGLCGSAAVRAARVLRRDGRHDISSRRTSTGPSPLEGPPAWHLWRPLHVPHRARTASTARPPRAGARGEQPGAFEAEVHRLKVPPDLAGALRLDTFLSEAVKDKTRARLQGCIKEGLVQVNGEQRCKTGYRLRPGDCVTLALPPPPPLNAVAEPIPLNIVFEDPDLLVVHKVQTPRGSRPDPRCAAPCSAQTRRHRRRQAWSHTQRPATTLGLWSTRCSAIAAFQARSWCLGGSRRGTRLA